jgi:mRNA interferase RelE/StbE
VSRPPFRVELAPAAQRLLRRLPPGVSAELRGPILALAIDPRPSGVVKLGGTEFWRLRAGDRRVIYHVDDAARMVVVLKVARRSESTYRDLRWRPRPGAADDPSPAETVTRRATGISFAASARK